MILNNKYANRGHEFQKKTFVNFLLIIKKNLFKLQIEENSKQKKKDLKIRYKNEINRHCIFQQKYF